MKDDTLKLIGYKVSGAVLINMSENESGWVLMDEYVIPKEALSKEMLLRCINDGGYGCKTIKEAKITIENVYMSSRAEYNRRMTVKGMPYRQKFFKKDHRKEKGISWFDEGEEGLRLEEKLYSS